MASPWICVSCRTRLPTIIKGARGVSQQAARRQGFGAVQETHGRDETIAGRGGNGNENGNVNGNESGNGNGSGGVRGRYSRREIPPDLLRPETLLHQLEEEKTRGGEARRDRVGVKLSPSGRTLQRRQHLLPPALMQVTEAFIAHSTPDNLAQAWEILSTKLAPSLRQIPFPPRRIWMRTPAVQPKLHEFRTQCTKEWLRALQHGALSTHSLPSPYEIVLLIEQLGFGKPLYYRPTLWEVAAGIHDLRVIHPHIDLQPALDELMKLWKLCHVVAISRTRTMDKGQPVLEMPTDWSFLPPLTIFATPSFAHDFHSILNTLVLVGGKESDLDPIKLDYASPALITLDLLRTTPCKMDDGTVGVCAELPDYSPWVKLMESLLRSSSLQVIPPCVVHRMFDVGQDLRERYERLLRRVGVKMDVLEDAKRRSADRKERKERAAVSKPAVEAVEAPPTTSTSDPITTSTPLHTSQNAPRDTPLNISQGTPQHPDEPPPREDAPGPTPHIKFTTRPDNPVVEDFALRQIIRLGRALEKSDVHQTEFIRNNIASFAASNNLTPTALPIEVYEHLMMVLFALKHPKSAVDVWKKFIQDGYVPTVKTYTVLMQGASHAHDVTSMEKFWQAMRQKLQPDSHAWSARINGLFRAKLPQKGLAALSEMGKEWYTAARKAEDPSAGLPPSKKASKASLPLPQPSLPSLLFKYPDSINGTPRPGLVVMNTAIAALASSYHDAEIPKVLHWGRTFQIEPDLITYNALLNICMRHSRSTEALSLLSRMREKGIEADSTTWTVLLTSLFQSGFLDDLTHEAQGKKVMEFIRSVELDGPAGEVRRKGGLDVKGYALIIDRLLKVHENTASAAEVLRYMVHEAKLRPTAQIYTILMTSYFFPPNNSLPDWSAIDTLWTQISTPDSNGFTPGLDPIFFDRMVEGYAYHHEIVGMKPAMDFLARMSERGMKPGFGTLEAVARMLSARGEGEILKRLVGEVRKRVVTGGRVWQRQREFWEFVASTGVVGWDEVDELIGNDPRGKRGGDRWMD